MLLAVAAIVAAALAGVPLELAAALLLLWLGTLFLGRPAPLAQPRSSDQSRLAREQIERPDRAARIAAAGARQRAGRVR
jgi:hypothetical protein